MSVGQGYRHDCAIVKVHLKVSDKVTCLLDEMTIADQFDLSLREALIGAWRALISKGVRDSKVEDAPLLRLE